MQEKRKKLKIVIVILTVLLMISTGGLVGRYIYLTCFAPAQDTATVPDNLIGDDTPSVPDKNDTEPSHDAASSSDAGQPVDNGAGSTPAPPRPAQVDRPRAPQLELHKGKLGDNRRFRVNNMFPGDEKTEYFCVKAYHDADIDLFFKVDITEQTEDLGEALYIRVANMDTGEVLCDDTFAEIDGEEFSELLESNADEETIAYYRVDVSLNTSAGNEYQAALLKADFKWYVKGESGLIHSPDTGDSFNLLLGVALAASSLLMVVFLWKRRKEDEGHGAIE